MGQDSKIEWCDHTQNFWTGCTKVSPACDRCYAEGWAKRSGIVQWGPHAERRRTSAANWRNPAKWNAKAKAEGVRRRVFTCSLADFFDNKADPQWRDDAWAVIRSCPDLDWLILTKRPQNIRKMLPADWGDGYPNVWLGTTVENQDEAERRIPHLLVIPAAIRFLSCEPLLGAVDLFKVPNAIRSCTPPHRSAHLCEPEELCEVYSEIAWIICGGESGAGARPMHPEWVRSLRDQCDALCIPFHFKQWGEWVPHRPLAGGDLGGDVRRGTVRIVHPTGQSDEEVYAATGGRNTIPGSRYMARIGKKSAGRILGGRTWDEFPAPA